MKVQKALDELVKKPPAEEMQKQPVQMQAQAQAEAAEQGVGVQEDEEPLTPDRFANVR